MRQSLHQIVGRYAVFDEIASGGMATVHIGRLLGAVGFSRTVAIKRLHPQFAKDPEFVDMFVDEARVAARIRHPNVVPTLDVVKTDEELFLVMEYVQGEALSRLLRRARRQGRPLELRMVCAIMAGVLHGLNAAHNAKGERGEELKIVHRDVSPQNVLVGIDGVSRVFDFGIAKARGRLQTTREGQIKGKLAYMAPEQLSGGEVGAPTDVYAAGVVLWEALAGKRLFDADHEAALLKQVLDGVQDPPSTHNPAVPQSLDNLCMMALKLDPEDRFQTARAMAIALEKHDCASATDVGEWVEDQASSTLQKRADRIAEIESQSEIKALAPIEVSSSRASVPDPDEVATVADPSSQMSSISVAGLPRKPTKSWPLAALLFLLLGAMVAVFALRGSEEGEREEGEGDTSPAASDMHLDGAPTGAPSSAKTDPPAAPSASATASSSAMASASATATATSKPPVGKKPAVGKKPVGGKKPPPPKAPPKPKPVADPCANPFYVDGSGIKRIKPQCR